MGKYILMLELTDKGRMHIHEMSKMVASVRQIALDKGAKVDVMYSVLGRWDLVVIVEAPDNMTMARVSSLLAATGYFRLETLPATAVEDYIEK